MESRRPFGKFSSIGMFSGDMKKQRIHHFALEVLPSEDDIRQSWVRRTDAIKYSISVFALNHVLCAIPFCISDEADIANVYTGYLFREKRFSS